MVTNFATFPFEHVSIRKLPYVVLDLETTGFCPPKAHVTEVAMIAVSGNSEESFHTLIDPKVPIPADITAITGITNEMVHGKPTINEVIPIIAEILDGSIFVSHNVPFDWSFIDHAWRQFYHTPLQMPSLCTLRLARKYLGLSSNKLGAVAKHLGVTLNDAHRAMGDTLALKNILYEFWNILESKGLKTGGDLLRAGQIFPSIPPRR